MKEKGLLLVISGFSGAGKGTVVKRLLELHNDYALSISATTRSPREGEQNGREYFFKSIEEFESMIDNSELIEYAKYVSNYYGTPKAYVEEQLEAGKNVILEIEIQGALKSIDGNAAMDTLNEKGALEFDFDGQKVELTKDDLLIEIAQTEGYVSDSWSGVTVVLDTNLTPELIEEGFLREIVSKIQTMRKEAGFEVMDTITIYADGSDKIKALLDAKADQITTEILATKVVTGELDGYTKEWDINGEQVTLGVKKN